MRCLTFFHTVFAVQCVFCIHSTAQFGRSTYMKPREASCSCRTMQETSDTLMVQICSRPFLFPLSAAQPAQRQLPDLPVLVAFFCKAHPAAQVLLSPSRPGPWTSWLSFSPLQLLPHFSLFQPWAAPTAAHLTASPARRMGSHRSMQLSAAAPPPPHQGLLTTESPLTDSSFHSLQLSLQLCWCSGAPLFSSLLSQPLASDSATRTPEKEVT